MTLQMGYNDDLLTPEKQGPCQKSNNVNVLDYVGVLATRVPNRDSILSSLESIEVDFSVTMANLADNLLLSSSKFRYSIIRFATISI